MAASASAGRGCQGPLVLAARLLVFVPWMGERSPSIMLAGDLVP